ncbi:type IV pilus twitching motility protein PilT [Tuwongella immobilis]|uniref:Bacterial type II secretion system protein E domain-containing protein n=1 Tax=Tuwongella immobilis TaxID=692036 RepID=A0A6C2YJK9_9BACT|nr:type IV pilus twitching motility protein PilT [Tuwongella immobilis]VIP01554.1 twitching motility protein : Twitching motility protein OS=Planctomyces brasiliensis (strain ATCC 49424 / DSM 5305 / JCM 21570 / NBRC 103401 / IFAM 1448) GN=Plabr_2546 PE=4 SV=1: T2SE [Tuwongella immobilis]VTR98753.1 twitching motility protein : Twitching motility protein OS=Planctomyces brasiliensis (strain ATCC 49424 / DSM 5305 / JCM 21570 / NBRC 103401 / IFAM 1448) GN=Plabr_2546 PE=4 SV=1: T2SE [Tuwongella immobi
MASVQMEKLLATIIQLKASDLHITVGQPPVVRHHGRMKRLETKSLDNDDTTALMKSITPDRCQQELSEKGGSDFAIEYINGFRFRVAVFKQRGSIGMVLRRIPSQFLTFEQLHMPEAIRSLIVRPRGLLLVTGPTGSGKTTSLSSMINFLNDNYDRHIITLEDPIEYYHKHKKCTVNQREIGVDVPDFKEGIRRALRMDPDIILVGEMRDLATIHAAIEAAETGHIVFGTLHTSGAASTVNRIIDVFPKDQQDQVRTQLSTALIGVLSQALLPKKPEGVIAAYEMMVVTPAIQNLIRENKTFRINSAIQTGRKHGMFLLDDSLFRLWKEGLCDKEEVLQKAANPAELSVKIGAAEKGILDPDEMDDDDDDDDYDDDDD